MPIIRAYVDDDWQPLLDICLLAFAPIHEWFERLLGGDVFRLVHPDWRASNSTPFIRPIGARALNYFRSLADAENGE